MEKHDCDLMVTLCPTFPHYKRFATDNRLCGIRLNSAMVFGDEINTELETAKLIKNTVPLYFDIKGRQLRILEVHENKNWLDITLNHPIYVDCPTPVLFKAGSDVSLLDSIKEGGRRLIFNGGPNWKVKPGESICIRHPSLKIYGPIFCDYEIEKIQKVVKSGINRFFLSYVETQKDLDEFKELININAEEIILKIESQQGLKFVEKSFVKTENVSLCAARGDLYVEIDKPHEILQALKLISNKDPKALVGSRLLLSVVKNTVPECHDFSDMAWLYDIGYKRMMLCDELCLKEDLLGTAINVFDCFRKTYTTKLTKRKWFNWLIGR